MPRRLMTAAAAHTAGTVSARAFGPAVVEDFAGPGAGSRWRTPRSPRKKTLGCCVGPRLARVLCAACLKNRRKVAVVRTTAVGGVEGRGAYVDLPAVGRLVSR